MRRSKDLGVISTWKSSNNPKIMPIMLSTLGFLLFNVCLLHFGSGQIGLKPTETDIRILVTLPLLTLIIFAVIYLGAHFTIKKSRIYVGLILLSLYFSYPFASFKDSSRVKKPTRIELDRFSTEKQVDLSLFSSFTLLNWLVIISSLVIISFVLINGKKHSLIIPVCLVLNSIIGLFNNGLKSAYTWAPSWRDPWYAYTYGDSNLGVVNSDEPVHQAVTLLFSEGSVDNLMLVRRAFPYFLASPASSLVNGLFAFQLFNFIFLLLLLYFLKLHLTSLTQRNGITSPILLTVSIFPQLVYYQNQSSGYFMGLICSVFLLVLGSHLVVQKNAQTHFWPLALIAIFAGISYDMVLNGLIISILLVRKKLISRWQALLLMLFSTIPGYLYSSYVEFITQTQISSANSGQIVEVFKNCLELFDNFNSSLLFNRLQNGLTGFLSTNGLIMGFKLLFVLMLLFLLFSIRSGKTLGELLEILVIVIIVDLCAHLIWNLGNGWQFNIPRLTAGMGLFMLIYFIVLLSRTSRTIYVVLTCTVFLIFQIIQLFPMILHSYELTWLSITGGY